MRFDIEVSNSALYTTRNYKQTWVFMLFGLLGSVFGVMSALSFLMKFIEMIYDMIHKYSLNKQNLNNQIQSHLFLTGTLPDLEENEYIHNTDRKSIPLTTGNTILNPYKGLLHAMRRRPRRIVPIDS